MSDAMQTVKLDCEECPFTTDKVKAAMDHAAEIGHTVRGPGPIEGTDLTISIDMEDAQ